MVRPANVPRTVRRSERSWPSNCAHCSTRAIDSWYGVEAPALPAPKTPCYSDCARLPWASRWSWNCDLADTSRARRYGVVPVTIPFEQYYNAAIRPPSEWAPDRLLRAWADTVARRLDATADVVPNVVGRLPITALVTLAADGPSTTVFVSHRTRCGCRPTNA